MSEERTSQLGEPVLITLVDVVRFATWIGGWLLLWLVPAMTGLYLLVRFVKWAWQD